MLLGVATTTFQPQEPCHSLYESGKLVVLTCFPLAPCRDGQFVLDRANTCGCGEAAGALASEILAVVIVGVAPHAE
jgi:hypothetical protein